MREHNGVLNRVVSGTATFLIILGGAIASPAAGQSADELTEARQSAGDVTVAVYGDPKGHHLTHERVLRQMAACEPQVILSTGDLVPVGFWQPSWNRFLRTLERVFPNPQSDPLYLAVPGNHDIVGDEREYRRWHRNLPWLPGNGTFYVSDHGSLRLIVLDANPVACDRAQTDSLDAWLEQNTRPWVIVAWHQVSFPFGSKPMHTFSRDEWWPLLYAHGVDLVINGHAHYYARSRRLQSLAQPPYAVPDPDGPIQIISATGGAGRYRVGKDDYNTFYFDELLAAAVDSLWSWCEITVTDSTLTLEARALGGDVFDRIQLKKTAPAGTPAGR